MWSSSHKHNSIIAYSLNNNINIRKASIKFRIVYNTNNNKANILKPLYLTR